jgi:hypothetical protein
MEEIKQEHPSQIQISFSRVQSSGPVPFYGSDIGCNSYIVLEIKTSVKTRQLSNDYFFADKTILRARLSPNQFAELLTTMNMCGGVPATLESFFPRGLPSGRIPEPIREDKVEIFKKEIDLDTNKIFLSINDLANEINELKISNKQKDNLVRKISGLKSLFTSTLPFIIEQAKEHVDNIITAGKGAIDSFYTGMINRLGIEALKDAIKVKMITKGDLSDDLEIIGNIHDNAEVVGNIRDNSETKDKCGQCNNCEYSGESSISGNHCEGCHNFVNYVQRKG